MNLQVHKGIVSFESSSIANEKMKSIWESYCVELPNSVGDRLDLTRDVSGRFYCRHPSRVLANYQMELNINKSGNICGKLGKSTGGMKRRTNIQKNKLNDNKIYLSDVC